MPSVLDPSPGAAWQHGSAICQSSEGERPYSEQSSVFFWEGVGRGALDIVGLGVDEPGGQWRVEDG